MLLKLCSHPWSLSIAHFLISIHPWDIYFNPKACKREFVTGKIHDALKETKENKTIVGFEAILGFIIREK